MSNIGGKKREQLQPLEYSKKVGLFEAKVIAVNPTAEEYSDVLGITLPEGNKAPEYLGTNENGATKLRIDFWLEEVKTKEKFKVAFWLENEEKMNKDGSKKQYINNVGICSWADDPNNLPNWFTTRDYRVAFVGEEDFYEFMRNWLGTLDYRDADTVLQLDWKTLMKGNVKDIKSQINGEFATNVVALATIRTSEKDGEKKTYQGVFNKAFLPGYALKHFRLVDYTKPDILNNVRNKKSKDLNRNEKFVMKVVGEYGCKDFYILKEIKDYNPNDNLVESDQVISSDGADY